MFETFQNLPTFYKLNKQIRGLGINSIPVFFLSSLSINAFVTSCILLINMIWK